MLKNILIFLTIKRKTYFLLRLLSLKKSDKYYIIFHFLIFGGIKIVILKRNGLNVTKYSDFFLLRERNILFCIMIILLKVNGINVSK